MNTIQHQKAAKEFAAHWEGKGYEKGESQIFWTTLLNQVFGIEHPETFIIYEHQVKLDHTSFIDGFIPTTKVMIEQKSLGKNLAEGIKQSGYTQKCLSGKARGWLVRERGLEEVNANRNINARS